MKIIGISAFYHDSAAALLIDGELVAAAQEERFTRKKHDPSFPVHSIRYCLEAANISLETIDAIAFYDKPFLKFERLLETYYDFAPRGLQSFIMSSTAWLKEKVFIKDLIIKELHKLSEGQGTRFNLLFPEHHLSHAASAYFPSPFTESAILTIDGVGEWSTGGIFSARGNTLTLHKESHFPHSLGLLYSAFTYFLGFRVNSGEYKLMGLAPYGVPGHEDVSRYKELIYDNLVTVKPDGSLWLNQKYFDYATGLRMINQPRWEKLFGFPLRNPNDTLTQQHGNLALAIQQVTEEIVLLQAKHTRDITGMKNLCLAGGVALNCVANGKLLRSGLFESIYIQPAAGDAGGAVGAAYAAYHITFGKAKTNHHDAMMGSYLGPSWSDFEIEKILKKQGAVYQYYDSEETLVEATANQIASGKVTGWVQGRMEFGPRALGARSILADARNPEMQKKLNLKIKYRESFRPFAPSVTIDRYTEYFNLPVQSPYMLLVADVAENIRLPLPQDYQHLPFNERLYTLRSNLPSITHLDMSARVQTVDHLTNPRYYGLLKAFGRLTGCEVLVNTSFNVRGEPIVCTPQDAYRCFMATEMDVLVVGNYLLIKEQQPDYAHRDRWKRAFDAD